MIKDTQKKSLFSQIIVSFALAKAFELKDPIESSDALILLSPHGIIQFANRSFCILLELSDWHLIGHSVTEFVHTNSVTELQNRLDDFRTRNLDREVCFDILPLYLGKEKQYSIQTDCLLAAIFYKDAPCIALVLRVLPIDRQLIAELTDSKEQYFALSETITETILRLDSNLTILFVNSAIKRSLGFETAELEGKNLSVLFPTEIYEKYKHIFMQYFFIDEQDRPAKGLRNSFELLALSRHRGVTPVEISFGNSHEFHGRNITCILRDISQRKSTEQRLRHLAFHDQLTGLGNRDLLTEDLQKLLGTQFFQQHEMAALFFMDLDGFKHVNDTLGHDIGDKILIETAKRIRSCLREIDSSYRFGGDEFVILLPKIKEASDALVVAYRILDSIRILYEVPDQPGTASSIQLTLSIGVALIPDHGTSLVSITRSADVAMYHSKENGKDKVTIYSSQLKDKTLNRWQIEQDIRSSFMKGEFEMHYQPILEPGGRLLGFESLMRWQRDNTVQPRDFISIAGDRDIIIAMGVWVFRRVIEEMQRYFSLGLGKIFFSINISPKQFENKDFTEDILQVLGKSGLTPDFFILELSEESIMQNPKNSREMLFHLKKKLPNLRLSIDSFGTGVSILPYIEHLPVDIIKVDKNLFGTIRDSEENKVLVAIIDLAHSLGMKIIATGIETKAEFSYFKKKRIYGMQGHFFMPAVPMERILDKIKVPQSKDDPSSLLAR